MDKKTAKNFIYRIEAHRERETLIWQEMRALSDYAMHEDKSIESILEERQRARELSESAEASLDAFDWVDDGTGNFVPREDLDETSEPIWPEISTKLRGIAGDNPKLLPIVEQIDRLHDLSVERGLPQITRADFEREMAAAASAGEAGTAETAKQGSVHEHAVAATSGETPNPKDQ